MSTGTQLKLRGLAQAESKHKEALALARFVAELLGADGREVSADSVFRYINPKALGNAAGQIFRDGPWQAVGFKESTRLERRAGLQRTWRLKKG